VKNGNRADYGSACVHGFIDANDGTIYKTLPWNHRGWHGGGSSNNTHIGVEMCEPNCIKYTGGATFTCSDVEKAKAMVKRTYEAAVELFAYLCKEFNLDPLADGVIISHKEGHKRGIASNHGDPEHLWNGLGMGYTMNTFRQAVKAAMGGNSSVGETAPGNAVSGNTGASVTDDPGYTLKQFIKDVQKACGAAVDGIAGPETISKTVTLSAKKNNRHAAVMAVQKRLFALGYIEVGKADGIAGPKFTSAVAHFQQDNGCVVDGEITARNKTWRKLLGME
jgi:N-acetylmuramoyl-L-alanine amidase CwlA